MPKCMYMLIIMYVDTCIDIQIHIRICICGISMYIYKVGSHGSALFECFLGMGVLY